MKFIDKFIDENRNRVLGLDIVRSFAILIVVYTHGGVYLPNNYKILYFGLLPKIDGVSMFFVLSGFLIGGILLRTIIKTEFTANDLLKFWIRRWFRTLPNYFIVLTGLVIYELVFFKRLNPSFDFTYYLFFQNIVTCTPDFFLESWSLSIEEWFYVLFPVAVFLTYKLTKSKNYAILFPALFFILIPFLLRLFNYYQGLSILSCDNYRSPVLYRLDSLMYGIFAAYLYVHKKEYWIKVKYICLILSILIIVFLTIYSDYNQNDYFFLSVYRYNLESIATFLLLPFFSQVISIRFKFITFLFTLISTISYSMYLLNYSPIICKIIPAIKALLHANACSSKYLFVFYYLTYWFLVITCSYTLYKYFEKPVMNLRDKINFFKFNNG